MVTARDQSCNIAQNSTQLAKYVRPLTSGKNLVSIPLELENDSIDVALQFANIEAAWWYDTSDVVDHWKMYNPSKPANDLLKVNYTMALWISVQSDTDLMVVGKVPANATINLLQGWNFVGYASFIAREVGDALSGVASYSRVDGFDDISVENLRQYLDDDIMMPGYGFWIKMDSPDVWVVTN
jgi:hypothetical protein